jgi:hypothetical protein
VIDRINYFISKDLARDQVNQLHKIWKSKNNDDNQQPDMFT